MNKSLIQDKIFTIGYSTFTINEFINLLKDYNINFVADVRSIPYSATFQDYNKDLLEARLKHDNIKYHNFKEEFGARQTDEQFFTDGYLDFTKFVKSEKFLNGVKEIINLINTGYKIVLMCAEKEPEICHRCIMIARYFYYELNYDVKHFATNGINTDTLSQKDINKYLVNKFFPPQRSLIDQNYSEEEMIIKSYESQNKEIGYRLQI